MIDKKKIQQIIIHSLKYIMNNNKNLEFDLLNNYNKFNMKMLKLTELKLYINNKLISKFCFHSHHIYNQIVDINYKPIDKIDLLNLDNIDIEFYSSINDFNVDKNCVKIYIYSNLYLEKNKKEPPIKQEIKIIDKIEDVVIDNTYSINNEPSTILDENELQIINWLNN
jgi:hypothetical protein